ncbi:hypothetical protein HPB48_024968 [Haemaphysalis longicornis]|uniref:Neurotransmitter-gated ion-channel ligand-binding domain-containing protein n=1 Tax=Haemaphysalis longicornis TaxID=44386 RepID=A0A9J6H725_HAELO|nr:hypothetical protein HPB48_024968 [Haemaphysalis longicornis]
MFSMDCYFRQTWYDRRLRFHGDIKVLSVSWQFLELVWKPDTFFFNGKSSYIHKVTVPNKFVRLFNDGRLMYSMRYAHGIKYFLRFNYPLAVISATSPLQVTNILQTIYSIKVALVKIKY